MNADVNNPTNRTLAVIDGGLSIDAGVRPTATSPKPKLLNQVREAIRTRHYSYRTEKAYVHWIKRFIFFHNKAASSGYGRGGNRKVSFQPCD